MQKKFQWKMRTLKHRKAALKRYLLERFGLTLEAFFVDRRIFTAAERELKKAHSQHARRVSPRTLADFETDNEQDEWISYFSE
jgi:hypothetical protein